MLRRVLVLFLFVIAASLAVARGVEAHPHAWVDLRSSPVFDADGLIIGIEQTWYFDIYYSYFIVDELEASGGVTDDALATVAAENMAQLAPFGYFNDARTGALKVALGEADSVETGIDDERIWMRFIVPLERPIVPTSEAFRYSIYDPTYYAEMLHFDEEPIMLIGDVPEGCGALLASPSPTFEAVELAAALDVDQSGGDGLGLLFSEWISVSC
ncbi:MAG: DUF1007 family protein [Alphaproteobacteria bacterium]|jgi:ABC-type uncharacterized transport system substrate-binding protein|nr:DUF1007 family protein [Rhodospirillaceae bacterium]MDG2482663.1 DUF1007 family protein [Alphaproteobacteria bacterium]MBT6202502.1 DUF1007 family protein [Rhodospirillaceae bacterium]MBT6511291.1 DUF1007 family protein [Rhodospirillaceae bacterium]MBT7615520.1 DUF1007 family protein [Rhodospirillaceae bacterium]